MNQSLHQAYSATDFRQMGYQLVNLLADHLASRQEENNFPAINWRDPEEELDFWRKDLASETPSPPIDFFKTVLDHSVELHNRRYMGHQISPPVPMAALAGFLSDFLNNGMGVYEMGQAGSTLDKVVIDFVAQYLGYDKKAEGILTSGGTLANLTGLLAARKAKAPADVWNEGHQQPLALMVSEQAHYCVDRAVRIMGWGEAGIIKVPTDNHFRMKTELLPEYLAKAEEAGVKVIAVVGSACTTSTGSFDDLEAIATFCQTNNLWFHVDGAHGAASIFSKRFRHLVKGIEQADSVVMDFHKMLMTPSVTTALVFKNGSDNYACFSQQAQYLWEQQDQSEWYNMAKRTFECTKLMMSLKAYSLIRTYGAQLFDDFVSTCYENGQLLASKIQQHPEIELAVQPDCNIVCFRFVPMVKDKDQLCKINERIRRLMLEDGRFYIVQTVLNGQSWLRVTLTNPFTRGEDLQEMLSTVVRTGQEILAKAKR